MQDIVSSGGLLPALLIAVVAGALSFFSPCVLPLVPGYLAYVGGSANSTDGTGQRMRHRLFAQLRDRVVLGTLLFVLGFTAVFVTFFSLAGTVGAWLLRYELLVTQILGAVIIVLGMAFMGLIRPLQRQRKMQVKPAVGLAGAPLLGAAFAIGWTPCIGPTLSIIFALSLQEGTAGRGALLGVAYCLGLGLPFILAACGFGWMTKTSAWVKRHMRQVNIAGGMLLLVIGLLMVTGLWTKLMYSLQAYIGGFTLPL